MRMAILGLPGAGKGTQSGLLSKKMGIPEISTVDLLKDAVSQATPLGKLVKQATDSGQMVSDEVIIEKELSVDEIVRKRIRDAEEKGDVIVL